MLEVILYQRCNIFRNLTFCNFPTSRWTYFILKNFFLSKLHDLLSFTFDFADFSVSLDLVLFFKFDLMKDVNDLDCL